jgi:hypothetical protein
VVSGLTCLIPIPSAYPADAINTITVTRE